MADKNGPQFVENFASIKVIGVATGHYIEQDLADAGADWVICTVENDFPV